MSALNNFAGASVNGSGAIIATARCAFPLDPSTGRVPFVVNTSDRNLDDRTIVNVNATQMPSGPARWMTIWEAVSHGFLDYTGGDRRSGTLVELNIATTPTRVNS